MMLRQRPSLLSWQYCIGAQSRQERAAKPREIPSPLTILLAASSGSTASYRQLRRLAKTSKLLPNFGANVRFHMLNISARDNYEFLFQKSGLSVCGNTKQAM